MIWLGTLAVLLLVISGTVYWRMNRQNPAPNPTAALTAGASTKGEAASPSSTATTSPAAKNPEGSGNGSTPSGANNDKVNGSPTSTVLTEPTGNFVSNHEPNLGGKPAPNELQSVCITTPGATCQITFTKDGLTRSLEPQKTDSSGAAYWTWRLQDVGLSAGSWQIQAKAISGDQVITAVDTLNLEVMS